MTPSDLEFNEKGNQIFSQLLLHHKKRAAAFLRKMEGRWREVNTAENHWTGQKEKKKKRFLYS